MIRTAMNPSPEAVRIKVMVEKIISFLVLGIFVFAPSVDSWLIEGLPGWYRVYIPWGLLVLAAIWLHYFAKDTFAKDTESS